MKSLVAPCGPNAVESYERISHRPEKSLHTYWQNGRLKIQHLASITNSNFEGPYPIQIPHTTARERIFPELLQNLFLRRRVRNDATPVELLLLALDWNGGQDAAWSIYI